MIQVLEFIFNLIVDAITGLVDAFRKQKGFNAAFAPERKIASRYNRGFVISKHRKLRRKASFQNLMLCGPTGVGKTSRLLIKTLFEMKDCSLFVVDPSKELFTLSSGYLSKFFDVKVINFSDASVSSSYNFLSRVKDENDVHKLSHILVASTLDKGGNSDQFWSLQSKTLLSIFIRLVLYQPEEYRHMSNVVRLLQLFAAKPEKVDELIAKSKDKKLLLEYGSLLKTPEKTLQSIVSSARSAVQVFENSIVAKITSSDSIDLEAIRRKPTVVFLHTSVADQRFMSTLTGMFFEQLYGHFLRKLPDKKELDVFVILEECASMYIPLLPLALANLRKHRVGNLICLQQGNAQLRKLYGDDAENITSNCVTKIYLPGITEISVLREIETLGGKCTYKDDKGAERVKSLISADECRLMKDNRSVILSANHPIIKGRTSPFYRSIKYSHRAKIPPLSLVSDIPDLPIPLID